MLVYIFLLGRVGFSEKARVASLLRRDRSIVKLNVREEEAEGEREEESEEGVGLGTKTFVWYVSINYRK